MIHQPSPKEIIAEILAFERDIYRIENTLTGTGIFGSSISFRTEAEAIYSIKRLFKIPDDIDTDPINDAIFAFGMGRISSGEAVEKILSVIETIES